MDHQPTESKRQCKNTATYGEYIKYRQQANPCITGSENFIKNTILPTDSCRIYALEYAIGEKETDRSREVQQVHPDDISSVLAPPPPSIRRRIIIIEDLHPSMIETLGESLDIDPICLADYLRTNNENFENMPSPPAVSLPPSHAMTRENWFNIHFQQIISLGTEETFRDAPWILKTSANVSRNVRRLLPISGRQIGIVRGCCSMFVKTTCQYCIGIIFVDSTTADIDCGPSIGRVPKIPFHGGIEDFRRPLSFSEFQSSRRHLNASAATTSTSLLHIVKDALAKSPPVLEGDRLCILDLAYYPVRTVIGEWMLYTQVLGRYIGHYECSFIDTKAVPHNVHENNDMADVRRWRHRVIQTRSMIQSTRQFIKYRLEQLKPAKPERGPWDLVLRDLDYLSSRIEFQGLSLESLVPVVTSVYQLLDSRRSIAEAVNVRRLTIIALIFVPLSWVASVFSMGEDFAPGQPKFWLYFVVSIPLCAVIVAFSFIAV
ncbi:hypothetical protein TWF730_009886 [Orbilia blumenaviensis]|uniref:Uncharacterized protein n=1 Tax=Orbilia blumenaviensis TaxID=1796055 RepID=A0AAV9UTC0_9PEZI